MTDTSTDSGFSISGSMFRTSGLDYGIGDTLEVQVRNGVFALVIDEPWAGDTETGFGQTCDLSLSTAQAVALARWILEMAEAKPAT